MMKRLLLYIIILVSLEGKAQNFMGRVENMSGKPLASASVVAKGDGGSVVAFARSGQDGSFSLTIPQGKEAKDVEFLMMGFAKVVISLKDYKNGQTVRMSEQAIALKEVKVTPQRIREEGDTLTYSVAGFRQKQDRSIADVCEESGVDTDFFLLICNVYTFNNYVPSTATILGTDMTGLVPYLEKSHRYYVDKRLPHIGSHQISGQGHQQVLYRGDRLVRRQVCDGQR